MVTEIKSRNLATETVERATLALEGVNHVHGSDGLALGVLSVGDSVPDNILKENLHNQGLINWINKY